MTIITYQRLFDFEFWSGAKVTAEYLTYSDFETIEELLVELYPDGCDETFINDLFWFEKDTIASWLGFEDWDNFIYCRFGNGSK